MTTVYVAFMYFTFYYYDFFVPLEPTSQSAFNVLFYEV